MRERGEAVRIRGLEGDGRQKAGEWARGSLPEEETGQSREGGLVEVVGWRCSISSCQPQSVVCERQRGGSQAACRSVEAGMRQRDSGGRMTYVGDQVPHLPLINPLQPAISEATVHDLPNPFISSQQAPPPCCSRWWFEQGVPIEVVGLPAIVTRCYYAAAGWSTIAISKVGRSRSSARWS